MTSLIFAALITPAFAVDGNWQTQLQFDNRTASAAFNGKAYTLDSNGSKRTIPRQSAYTETASPLFDALFALAQVELDEARIKQITDSAFNHGKPLPCDCFETGKKWTYVWTRDSAYSIDLALAALDSARSRRTLEFKLSGVREASAPQGSYIVQDTGSGGSWPISTDRVVWFLGARHLLDDKAFADKVYKALNDTLTQDRRYVFDADFGLYRGETSFLDWREQTYPYWTEKDVRYIAESFALSTNVLHYEALRLAKEMSTKRNDTSASTRYGEQADALKAAIHKQFWREDRGTYMSYIGNSAGKPQPIEAYDLLGTALAILAGIPDDEHARRALANYPTYAAGSPVIWPERKTQAIYHNRAIWPFVSAYALKAARAVDDAPRIAHELKSILRGATLSGSNMENYEFVTQSVHVEDGKLSGPVVNSPRQLWSVAAAFEAALEGVFGIDIDAPLDAAPHPKLPVELVPALFGERKEIRLTWSGRGRSARTIVLQLPAKLAAGDNLLVADSASIDGKKTVVTLRGRHVEAAAPKLDAPAFAPSEPTGSPLTPTHTETAGLPLRLYDNNKLIATWPVPRATAAAAAPKSGAELPDSPYLQTIWNTRFDPATKIESLPGPIAYVGQFDEVKGAEGGKDWPRHWTAPRDGRFQLRIKYTNSHGPINTGVTAAVKTLVVRCADGAEQTAPIVMPHSVGEQISTAATFKAQKGQACTFALEQGFNMSFLAHYSQYTGEQGGVNGPVNEAVYEELQIVPLE